MKMKKMRIISLFVIIGAMIAWGVFFNFKDSRDTGQLQLADKLALELPETFSVPQELSPATKDVTVSLTKEEPKPISKRKLEFKDFSSGKEPAYIDTLKKSGIDVKGNKEMASLSEVVNEYYQKEGFPPLDKKYTAELPENAVPGELIVKSREWIAGGTYKVRYDFLSVAAGEELRAIDIINDDPDVIVAEANVVIKIMAAVAINLGDDVDVDVDYDPMIEEQWALGKIEAPEAWEIERGDKSIKIAIIDTGVDLNHKDLKDNIDFDLSCDYINDDEDPEDESETSHGTHVAGIIAAKGFNGIGVHGVMSDATLIIHKVLRGETTNVTAMTLASTISQAIAKGARVINMSWTTETDMMAVSATLKDIFQTAFARTDVLLVAAVGNSKNVFYPAKYEEVLAVGGTDKSDSRWVGDSGFESAYGDEVDVAAPAEDIYSTIRCPEGEDEAYASLPGTSMAAAFVSGLAGLLLSKNPDLTKEELITLIKENVDEIETDGDKPIGTGRINAKKALDAVGGGIIPGDLTAVAQVGQDRTKTAMVEVGEDVQFYGDKSSGPEGFELQYSWDFGELIGCASGAEPDTCTGFSSTEKNPTYKYSEEGKYEVTLMVATESHGADNDEVKVRAVGPVPDGEIWVAVTVTKDGEVQEDVAVTIRLTEKRTDGIPLITAAGGPYPIPGPPPFITPKENVDTEFTDSDGQCLVKFTVEADKTYKIEGQVGSGLLLKTESATSEESETFNHPIWYLIADAAVAGNMYTHGFNNGGGGGGGGGNGDTGGGDDDCCPKGSYCPSHIPPCPEPPPPPTNVCADNPCGAGAICTPTGGGHYSCGRCPNGQHLEGGGCVPDKQDCPKGWHSVGVDMCAPDEPPPPPPPPTTCGVGEYLDGSGCKKFPEQDPDECKTVCMADGYTEEECEAGCY